MAKKSRREKRLTVEYLQKEAGLLKKELRLPVSEYTRAWATYNRRWVASWIILAIVILYAIMAAFFRPSHGPTSKGSLILWVAAIAAVQLIFYFRFIQWPCPRCGKPFNQMVLEPQRKFKCAAPFSRFERCQHCGLRRNTVPEESKTRKLKNSSSPQDSV
jgi:hypothetical protein